MIRIHPDVSHGPVKPLNGVNLGPIDRYWTRNYTEHYKRAKISSVRVHDASLFVPDTVELHCIFPDVTADPDDPASYEFGPTDAYLQAIRDSGADIDFRIGEAIEHGPHHMWIKPDRWTPELLARVSVNIARHYNDGWANGHEWGIKRWTFWEESDNAKIWTGSADDLFHLYTATARALKQHDESLQVGLAAFTQRFVAGLLKDPGAMDGWGELLPRCAAAGVPVDFVSWNYYGDSLSELAANVHGMRNYLDDHGLAHAENHVAEWNFNPSLSDDEGEYTFMSARIRPNYRRTETASKLMNSARGAAYVFGALAHLQDTPLDAAHLYIGTVEPWGLFTHHGGPNLKFDAFAAFGEFLGSRPRVQVDYDVNADTDAPVIAVAGDGQLTVGIAHEQPLPAISLGVPGAAGYRSASVRQLTDSGWADVSATVDSAAGTVDLPEARPGVTIVELSSDAR